MPQMPIHRSLMDYISHSPAGDVVKQTEILGVRGGYYIYLLEYISLLCFLYESGAILGRALKEKSNTLEKLLHIKYQITHISLSDWQILAEERLKKYEEECGKQPDNFYDFIFDQEASKMTRIKINTKRNIKSFYKKLYFTKVPLKDPDTTDGIYIETKEKKMCEYIIEGSGFGSRFPELTREMNGRYWSSIDIESDDWNNLTKNFKFIDTPLRMLTLNWQEKSLLEIVQFYIEECEPELQSEFQTIHTQEILMNGYLWQIYYHVPLREQTSNVTEKNLLDVSKYTNPGDYKRDCAERGIGVSTSFCHAVSEIMYKHNLTFQEACKLLEDNGYLMWAGNMPIYNLAGDKLWMKRK